MPKRAPVNGENLVGKILLFKENIYTFKAGDVQVCLGCKNIGGDLSLTFVTNAGSTSFRIWETTCKSYFDIIEPGDSKIAGKRLAITGTLNHVREYYKTLIECLGGVYSTTVSSKTDYLITDARTPTTKMIAAKANGTQILSSKEFLKLIDS